MALDGAEFLYAGGGADADRRWFSLNFAGGSDYTSMMTMILEKVAQAMRPVRNMPGSPFFVWLVALWGASGVVWWLMACPQTGIDDADIFLVYARNFSEGHGFVYHVGGERVEGFTSMLWVLLEAGFFKLFSSIEGAMLGVNVVCGALTLAWCQRRLRQPFLFALLVFSAPAWVCWSVVTLMETGLWCLLVTGMVLALAERRSGGFMACLGLMAVTRPESLVWGVWALLLWGVFYSWRSVVIPCCVFAGVVVGLVGFRMAYFGYPVPNTFYAKVSPDMGRNLHDGSIYLWGFLNSHPLAWVGVLTVIGVVVRAFRAGWPPKASLPLMVSLALLPGLGIPVLVGGDHFGSFRFYQPLWPLLCLLIVLVWGPSVTRRKWMLLPVLLAGCFLWKTLPVRSRLFHEFHIAQLGRTQGAQLMELYGAKTPLPSVAVITAGGVAYSYPGPVFDLMGLNAVEMAHAKKTPGAGIKNHSGFSTEVFWRWEPDLILPGETPAFDLLVLQGLFTNGVFQQHYALQSLALPDGGELSVYARRPECELEVSLPACR